MATVAVVRAPPAEVNCGPSIFAGMSADLDADACGPLPGSFCGPPMVPVCAPAAPVGDELKSAGYEATPEQIAYWKAAKEDVFNPENPDHRIERTFYASLSFSLAQAGKNPELCEWRIPKAMLDRFKRRPGDSLGSTALIGVKVKSIWTTDVVTSYALIWSGIPETGTLLQNGSASQLILFPDERNRNANIDIFKAGPDTFAPHLAQYAGLTEHTLYEDISPRKGTEYYYVPDGHPVVRTVRKNAKKLGISLGADALIDGDSFKLHKVLVNRCVTALLTAVAKLNLKDLSQFGFRVVRADGEEMHSKAGIEQMAQNEVIQSSLMKQNQKIELVIEVAYGIVGQGKSA